MCLFHISCMCRFSAYSYCIFSRFMLPLHILKVNACTHLRVCVCNTHFPFLTVSLLLMVLWCCSSLVPLSPRHKKPHLQRWLPLIGQWQIDSLARLKSFDTDSCFMFAINMVAGLSWCGVWIAKHCLLFQNKTKKWET